MDQRQLVERARRGDHDAFALLAGLFVARLDSAARLILRDHGLAQDAVQEGFLGRGGACQPFAIRIASRPGSAASSSAPASTSSDGEAAARSKSNCSPLDGPAIGDIASAIADRDLLDAALRRLQPEQRAVVVMHYYLGMPLPDVSCRRLASRSAPSGPGTIDRWQASALTIDDDENAPPRSARWLESSTHDRFRSHRTAAARAHGRAGAGVRFPTTSTTCSGRPIGLDSGLAWGVP